MRSHFRPWTLILLSGVLAAASLGCQEEGQNTRNIVHMISLNENAPLFSDVAIVEESQDAMGNPVFLVSVEADMAEVSLASRLHDPALSLTPNGPFGTVRFSSYDVEYHPGMGTRVSAPGPGLDLDGNGTADLLDFTGGMSLVLPIGGTGSGAVQVVSVEQKTQDPVACLGPLGSNCSGVTNNEYSVVARVFLHGVEETSGDDVLVEGAMVISLADYADEE